MMSVSKGKGVFAERKMLKRAAAESALFEAAFAYIWAGGEHKRAIDLAEMASMLVEQQKAENARIANLKWEPVERHHPPPPRPTGVLDTNRVIDAKAAAVLCGVTAQTWRRMYTKGSAPAPIRLSVRRIGWRISTLLEWLDSKEKGS